MHFYILFGKKYLIKILIPQNQNSDSDINTLYTVNNNIAYDRQGLRDPLWEGQGSWSHQ